MTENHPDVTANTETPGPSGRSISMTKLGPVETSILEYVLSTHGGVANRRACLISLLIHAQLLARGARPTQTEAGSQTFAIPSAELLNSDPIRLYYLLIPRPKAEALAGVANKLQLSVVETDAQIFISLTDTTTDKFGHVELSGLEHVRLDAAAQYSASMDLQQVYPQLNDLLDAVEEQLWKPVLPSPPLDRLGETAGKQGKKQDSFIIQEDHQRFQPMAYDPSGRPGGSGYPFPDYGRSDLDPLGSLGGRGGMILDPRRPLHNPPFGPGGAFMGGPDVLPPGAVPPGARFDPFGPGIMPGRPHFGGPGGRMREPDPDHALPPGFEDVYL